jgi:hypothetical protein
VHSSMPLLCALGERASARSNLACLLFLPLQQLPVRLCQLPLRLSSKRRAHPVQQLLLL